MTWYLIISPLRKWARCQNPTILAWAFCQVRIIAGALAPGMPGTFSPRTRGSDPVTHVPWCMSGSLTSGFFLKSIAGKNVPGIPGAYATRNFTYLERGPLHRVGYPRAPLQYKRTNSHKDSTGWSRVIFIIWIHLVVKRYLCIVTSPRSPIYNLKLMQQFPVSILNPLLSQY